MANVFIYDKFTPEDNAMLQALYSRSAKSVRDHVAKVEQSGSGSFMETFYVGYGHLSIADCGSTTMFIEGLSTLADKAIQDWPLYSGQETSTRYIDMSKQPIIDPVRTKESKQILNDWMDFYINSQEELKIHLKQKFPIKPEQKEEVYNKAIAAKAFDIMRGFLPAGITTQLSWHTNLRQAWDKIVLLRNHPLKEVKDIAENMLSQLKEKYSHSFSHENHEVQEEYRMKCQADHNYFNPETHPDFKFSTTISNDEVEKYTHAITERPFKTNLPLFMFELGTTKFDFLLDYGSFRDIQRHRNGSCRMPLVTTKFGFGEWYLSQLPPALRAKADELIKTQTHAISKLDTTPEIKQYYIAMGFKVPCRVSYGLPATVYTVELRSGKAVHPTLRAIAHKMHHAISQSFPKLKLYSDLEQSEWDIARGLQDITERK